MAVTDAVLTASRLLVAVSARSIAAVDDSITIPQFRMLVVLNALGPMKPSAVAEILHVNPSNATRMVDRLVLTNMVERHANPTIRREMVLSLTTTGAKVVTDITQQRHREIADIVGRMPEWQRKYLVDTLDAFNIAGGASPVPFIADDWI
ncbi:MAG TPA: MarR family transcriptional regulator [Pseudonocardiaceae bacterium]|jgi:DNA-binding MarR family transcriptional regulator|nr:MarR family transcriptional regulator [Pseudonocardiaceae bacterium]